MATISTPTTDPVTRFLSRFSSRDLGHFVAVYGAGLASTLNWTSWSALKASAISAIPAAATVLFRQVFPHNTATAAELNTAVSLVVKSIEKASPAAPAAPAPTESAPVA